MYVLNTDTISLMQFGHAVLIQRAALEPDSTVFLSAISVQEQMKGWIARLSRLRTPAEFAKWYDHLVDRIFPVWKRYEIVSFKEPDILRFENLQSQRLNVDPMDLRIAAIALEYVFTVVTRNRCDFGRVPGLKVEDWSV